MSMRPLKITFHMDGSGLYYDPFEPPMFDSILDALCGRRHRHGEPPARDEEPTEVNLPLAKWHDGEVWGWRASALFPEGETAETLTYWRKRLRQNRIELTDASPNVTNGVYRDWNMPVPLLLTHSLVAYAVGDRRYIRNELRELRWIGKKRAHGHGRVVGIEVDAIEGDWSCVRDSRLTRWMPRAEGVRLVRPRPPYWNAIGRVSCGEIGDAA